MITSDDLERTIILDAFGGGGGAVVALKWFFGTTPTFPCKSTFSQSFGQVSTRITTIQLR